MLDYLLIRCNLLKVALPSAPLNALSEVGSHDTSSYGPLILHILNFSFSVFFLMNGRENPASLMLTTYALRFQFE